MKYTFYPGCSLSATGLPYAMSFREVARVLGLEMPELEDWNCCGATTFQTLGETSAAALSGRNLALAEREGSQDLVTPCSGCFAALRKAKAHLDQHPDLRQRVETALAEARLSYRGTVEVRHLLDVLANDVGLEAIKARVRQPLTGLKLACYYGCLLTRPPATTKAAHHEYPVAMDRLMAALGAHPVDWSYKTECCGASFSIARPELVVKLTGRILDNARQVGAEAVVTACPLCQANLDSHHGEHTTNKDQEEPLPILYFTELMGVAFGIGPRALGLNKHFRDPQPLLQRHGLLGEASARKTA